MEMLESVKLAAESIWSSKMRSFLTMLGIIIGVGAVIAVMAIGQGGKGVILKEVEGLGANAFIVTFKQSAHLSGSLDNKILMNMDDIKAIKRKAPAVKYIYPVQGGGGDVRFGKITASAQTIATTPDYKDAQKMELSAGRFFNEGELRAKRKVAVIDSKMAKDVFKNVNPLGKRFRLNGSTWTVVGVVKERKSTFDFVKMPGTAIIPVTTYQNITGDRYFYNLQGSAKDKDALDEATSQVKTVLNKEHNTSNKYDVQTLDTIVQSVNKVVNILTLIVGSIAGISLFVGGIGVMNIMLVSVTERTREIGIRKSLGATRGDILRQFLVEALVLCLSGGLLGIILGAGSALLISHFLKFPPLVNGWTVLVAVSFSLAVGIFFGLYPANKAAKLDPIEALRYE